MINHKITNRELRELQIGDTQIILRSDTKIVSLFPLCPPVLCYRRAAEALMESRGMAFPGQAESVGNPFAKTPFSTRLLTRTCFPPIQVDRRENRTFPRLATGRSAFVPKERLTAGTRMILFCRSSESLADQIKTIHRSSLESTNQNMFPTDSG